MGARESLQKLIDRKQAEIVRLEKELRDAKVYIQAVQDSFRLLPKEISVETSPRELRAGSMLAKVQEFLRKQGKPEHISAILEHLGKPQDKQNRVSLSGSLGAYAKELRIFTRAAPNTFGLIEFGEADEYESDPIENLPDGFGKP